MSTPGSGSGNPTIQVPLYLYGKFFESLFDGAVNFSVDPLYMMLCTNGYVPNQDTHQYKSDIASETSGSGYFEGGQDITDPQASYNVTGTTKLLSITGGNLVWPVATFDAAFGVLYMASSEPETLQPLVGYFDFLGTQSPNDEAFYVNWNNGVIFNIQIPDAAA